MTHVVDEGRLTLDTTVADALPGIKLDGDNFVRRSHEGEPWATVFFGALNDGAGYLFSSGR